MATKKMMDRMLAEIMLLAGLLANPEVTKRYTPDKIVEAAKNYLKFYLGEEIQ